MRPNYFISIPYLKTEGREGGSSEPPEPPLDLPLKLSKYFIAFHNEVNKFNNTGALMLDSIYHMALKLIKNHIFGVSFFMQLYKRCHYVMLLNL